MKKRKITILILTILLMITICAQSVYGESSMVNRAARVDHTYDWSAGIYGMQAEKNQFVTIKGVKNTSVDYEETSESNYEIEPSVGYAYYVARSEGLNDSDMQSVIYMSDRWGNTSNVKVKGSEQQIDGEGIIYQRASQYGDVYYGILQDAIKDNKKVLRIKDENSIKSNIKVLADQENGTYTVGPYVLELNVNKNNYTDSGAKILLKELSKDGNAGFSESNAFAKYNGITGINGKEAIFVDANGSQIPFPDFTPGAEKEFYIRFKPNNNGAIDATGNPIVNVSYLTKFVAKNFIKGVPKSVKFGDASTSNKNLANTETTIIKEEKLNKRNYAAVQRIKINNGDSSLMQQLGSGLQSGEISVETSAMRRVGEWNLAGNIAVRPSPKLSAGSTLPWDSMHEKDLIRINPDGSYVWTYYEDINVYQDNVVTVVKDGIITDSFKVDSFQHEGLATAAYEGELTVNGNPISRNNTHYQWISDVTTEASDKLGTVTITCDKANKDIVFSTVPEEITSKQSSVINRIFG